MAEVRRSKQMIKATHQMKSKERGNILADQIYRKKNKMIYVQLFENDSEFDCLQKNKIEELSNDFVSQIISLEDQTILRINDKLIKLSIISVDQSSEENKDQSIRLSIKGNNESSDNQTSHESKIGNQSSNLNQSSLQQNLPYQNGQQAQNNFLVKKYQPIDQSHTRNKNRSYSEDITVSKNASLIFESGTDNFEEDLQKNNIRGENNLGVKNFVTSDNEELLIGNDFIDGFPPCAEKYLKELIILAKTAQDTPEIIYDKETILKLLIKLQHHLTQESLLRQDVERALQESFICCNSKDFKGLLTNLKSIKKQILILDISKLKAMFQKGFEAAKRIQGKNIFILLGVSGVGKSTTIHFLAGSQMIETKVGNVTHIGPSKVNNPQAEEIMTGPFAFSVTKFIHCVNVDDLIICDSPGFQDSQGYEVDIANGVGVVNGIKGCQSVLVGFVVSFKSTGERYKGIKSLAKLVASMFTNLENHIGTFIYIFTKFPEKDQRQVSHYLKSVLNSLNDEEKLDLQFVMLLEDLQKKAEDDEILFINPLTDNPKKILKKLKLKQAISNPNDAIQQYISQESADALRNQCHLHSQQIVKAVVRNDIEFISHKLDELHFVNTILNKPYIKIAYDDSIKHIVQFFDRQSGQLKSALEKCFDLDNMLTQADLKQFEEGLLTFKKNDILKNKYLNTETEGTDQLMEFLKNQVNNLIEQSNQLSYSDNKMVIILDKLQLTSQEFKLFEFNYKNVITNVSVQMQQHLLCIEQIYKNFEFQKTAKTFFQFKICQKNLNNHLADSLNDHLEKQIENFQSFLESQAQEVNEIISVLLTINNEDDKNVKIKQIAKIIENIECFKKEFQAYKNEDILKIVNAILQGSYKNVLEFILQTIKVIEGAEINNSSYFIDIKQFLITVKNLRDHIQEVKVQSVEIYYKIEQKIFSKVNLTIKETKDILDNLLTDGTTEIKIDALYQKLKILLSSEWLDQFRERQSTQACEDFFKQIQNCGKKLEAKANRINITIKGYDNMSFICTIINQAQGLKAFDKINPNAQLQVASIADSIQNRFIDQIQEVSKSIEMVIQELEKINMMEEELKLESSSIKKIEESCIFLVEMVKLQNQQEYQPLKTELLIILQDQLISKIANHHVQCKQYIKDTFRSITSYKGENREKLLKDSSNFEDLLISIQKVKEKTVHFNNYLDTDPLIKESSNLLKNQADDFRDQLGHKLAIHQQIHIELEIIRSLKRVDNFNIGEKYTDIYKDFSTQIYQQISNNQSHLFEKIRKHDFLSIESDLLDLQSQKGNDQQLTKICNTITSEVTEIINDAKTMSIHTEFKFYMTSERIQSIVRSVRKIQDCQKLEQFLTYKNFDVDIKNIIDVVSENYTKRLNQIENQIKQYNFFEANQELEDIQFVRICLDKYCSNEILKKIEAINTLKEQTLRTIFNTYENLDIAEYNFKAPKVILEKLLKANLESDRDKLVDIIRQKFSEKIYAIKNKTTRNTELVLGQLMYLLPFIGDILELQIKFMIQQAIADINYEQDLRLKQIDQAKYDFNTDLLVSLLKESQINCHFQEEEKIRSYFREILEKNFVIIDIKINSLDEEVKMKLKEIAEIKNNLDKLNLSTQFYRIKEVQQKIKNLFNEAVQKTDEYLVIYEENDEKSNNDSLSLNYQTRSKNIVTHKHLIELISFRISSQKVILAFIPDFDKKLCQEIQTLIENIEINQFIIKTSLIDGYPDLQEIKQNLQYIIQKTAFLKKLKEKVSLLMKTFSSRQDDEKSQIQPQLENQESSKQMIEELQDKLDTILRFPQIIDKINKQLIPITQEIEEQSKKLIK